MDEKKELSFEECLKELEKVVSRLESKDISLDEAVKSYERGLELSKRCYEIFNKTEEIVVKAIKDSKIEDFNAE